MAKNISTGNEEYARIEEMYELQNLDLLTLKKSSWKEMLLKANESFKSLLYEYVEGNKSLYKDCEYFTELVQGKKTLEDCLLEMGHIIRVWLSTPDNAIMFYQQATVISPTDPSPYFFLGVTYRGKGEYKKAIDMYKKALDLKPAYPDCLFNMGNIYFEY